MGEGAGGSWVHIVLDGLALTAKALALSCMDCCSWWDKTFMCSWWYVGREGAVMGRDGGGHHTHACLDDVHLAPRLPDSDFGFGICH